MKHTPHTPKPPFPRAADASSLNPTLTQQKLTALLLGAAQGLQSIARKAHLQPSTQEVA